MLGSKACTTTALLVFVFCSFYFILFYLSYVLLLPPDAVLTACLEFSSPIFHCQPLADISVGPILTQSSLYPFCTLPINSLQNTKFVAVTLMLCVTYHARYIFFCFPWSPTKTVYPQSSFLLSGLLSGTTCSCQRPRVTGFLKRKIGFGWKGR